MKIRFLLALGVVLLACSTASADLVSYWNFNDLSISSASAPGSGGVPTSINASSGAGSVDLTSWSGLVDDFGGTTTNALNSDPSEESLSLVGQDGNSSFIDIDVSLSGFMDPILTFATRGTGTGFSSGIWSWSTDGTNFTSVAGNTSSNSSGWATRTVDLSGVASLSNAGNATFRYTLDGASSSGGNNRIDNLQINATAVPEPSSIGVLALAGLAFLRRKRS